MRSDNRRSVLAAAAVLVASLFVAVPARAVSIEQDFVVSDDPADWTPHVIDGRVNAIADVGGKIVVGGDFTQVRQPGHAAVERHYLFAFDRLTGAIDPDFVPVVDNVVEVVKAAPGGGAVFVGGRFLNVNGVANSGVAKLDIANGARVVGFSASTAGKVRDLVVSGGRVFLGGDMWSVNGVPRARLAAIDATTGVVDPSFQVALTRERVGNSWITRLDVSPDGSQMVIVGNFLEVDGIEREQIALIDLTTSPASVADWSTQRYAPRCSSNFWTYMRDVEYSPDGEYFVVVTTGAPYLGTLCDSAARWESDTRGSGIIETWQDLTGGDTLTSVAVTGGVVYVGGHQRWLNNHLGRDSARPGAVPREGIAALDPLNGVPFSWNPGKDRGVGVFDIHPTPEGLYIGSDTDWTAGEYHPKLAMFPTAGATPIPKPTPVSLPSDLFTAEHDGSLTTRSYDGAIFGDAMTVSPNPVDWSTVSGVFWEGKTLYYVVGSELYGRSFDGEVFGSEVHLDTWNSWEGVRGLTWDAGRLYYVRQADPRLLYQYFSLESGIVGSQTFAVSGNGDGMSWLSAVALSIVDDQLYFATSDGNLHRITMIGGVPEPATEELVSGPATGDGRDWNTAGVFFLSVDSPPTVGISNPAEGDVVSGTVTVVGTAEDDDAVLSVEFFVDDASIGADDDGADGWEVAWDTSTGVDGATTLRAEATDSGSFTSSIEITVTVDNNPPTVAVVAPTDLATVGGFLTVTADAADTAGVASVEFFVDGGSLGTDTSGGDGWSVPWDTTTHPNGPATITATAVDLAGFTAEDSVSVVVDNTASGVIVMVVGNPTAPTDGEVAVRDRLEGLDFAVTMIDDNGVVAGAAEGSSLVIISSSVLGRYVGSTFNDVPNPVWVAKPWLFDDVELTGPVGNTDYGVRVAALIDVVDHAHPMAAGKSGSVQLTANPMTIPWAVPVADAEIVATLAGDAAVFAVSAGSTLDDGSSAAGCRLSFPIFQSGPAWFTDDAWEMFDATAIWAAGGCSDTAPSVSITTPPPNAIVGGAAVMIRAAATDDLGVAEVEFFADGSSLGIDTTAADGWRMTWDSTASEDGAITLNVVARDASGQTDSDAIVVIVDNTAPSVTLIEPIDGTTVSGNTVAIVAQAVDAGGVEQVQFLAGGVGIATDADGSDGWSTMWDSAGSPDGPVTLTAVATDHVGLTDSQSITVLVDNESTDVPPVVTLTDPANASTVAGSSVLVSADATDDLGVTKVEFFASGVSIGIDTSAGDGWFVVWNSSTVSDGPVEIVATVTDTIGQTDSDSISVVVDNEGPIVSMTAPADGATVAGMTVVVSAAATDAVGVAGVEFFADGTSIGVDADGGDGWSVSWDSRSSPDGSVELSVRATDTFGRTAVDAVTVIVDNAAARLAVMVVGNPGLLGAGEQAVVARLESLTYTVSLVDDTNATASDASGADLVLVSQSVRSVVGDTFAGVAVPVIISKPWLFDDMKLTGPVGNVDYGVRSVSAIDVVDSAHPMAAGRSGLVAITTSSRNVGWGIPGAAASVVATAGGDPTMFAYEAGDTLFDGSAAPGCRIVFPVYQDGPAAFTADAWAMFDATIQWAASGCATSPVDDPPWVVVTEPEDGAVVSGDVVITADAGDDVGVTQVEFLAGGSSLGTDEDAADGWQITWDTSASPNGPVVVTATARDTAGHTGSDSISVEVENGAPPDIFAILVSVDGLRPDTVTNLGPAELPNLFRLMLEGASTSNARTAFETTQTLPSHTSLVTGLGVDGPTGHGVTFNEDNGLTVHDAAGRYVPSVFDVAHDNGASTLLYAGKPKFDFLDRSWNGDNGAADTIGGDDGRDKIDHYLRGGGATITSAYLTVMASESIELSVVHYAEPDAAGHDFGWGSPEYEQAIRSVDTWVGQILDLAETDPDLAGKTFVVLTADHGGTSTDHADPNDPLNYTIPFYVWGEDVPAGGDLYTMNHVSRADPGAGRPDYSATPQPIRNADAANLALGILEFGPVPASTINSVQDLRVTAGPDQPPTVTITAPAPGAVVAGVVTIVASATDDIALAGVDFSAGGSPVGSDSDGSDGWSVQWDSTAGGDGSLTLVATARDSAGQSATDSVTVTVDNVPADDPPTIAITSPAEGAVVAGTVTVDADADDDGGVVSVEFFVGGSSLGIDEDGTDGWSSEWITTADPDGEVTVAAVAVDTVGQVASDEVVVTVQNVEPQGEVILTGTVDADRVLAPRWVSTTYSPETSGVYELTLDWTGDAMLRFDVRDSVGHWVGSNTSNDRPKSISVTLESGEAYRVAVWSMSGVGDFVVTVEAVG